MQTQTRRLQRVALLATRQEAEFASGVLDAADIPHAIVETSGRFELRVDDDDTQRVRELLERLDVQALTSEGTRKRRAESLGRRIVLLGIAGGVLGLGVFIAIGVVPMPRGVSGISLGLLLGIAGATLGVVALVRRGG